MIQSDSPRDRLSLTLVVVITSSCSAPHTFGSQLVTRTYWKCTVMKPYCGPMERLNGDNNWSRWGDTYRRKADPLHGRPKHPMPARRGEKWEEGGRLDNEKSEKRSKRPCMIRGREDERAGWWLLPHLCLRRQMTEGRRSSRWRIQRSRDDSLVVCLAVIGELKRLFVESLLAGNLLHPFCC